MTEKLIDQKPSKYAKNMWWEFLHEKGLCGLCGNHGIVDTRRNMFTPAGVECGVRRFCICPNGRAMKKQGAKL